MKWTKQESGGSWGFRGSRVTADSRASCRSQLCGGVFSRCAQLSRCRELDGTRVAFFGVAMREGEREELRGVYRRNYSDGSGVLPGGIGRGGGGNRG